MTGSKLMISALLLIILTVTPTIPRKMQGAGSGWAWLFS